jgi:hypothetical protein
MYTMTSLVFYCLLFVFNYCVIFTKQYLLYNVRFVCNRSFTGVDMLREGFIFTCVASRVGLIWVQPIPIPIQIYSHSRYFCQYRYRYISTNISATYTNTDILIWADICPITGILADILADTHVV